MPGPELVLIAAVARNRVIGHDNRLPWHLPEDLRRFKATTLGHPIVMGRKTWESLGRPLPGRRNIVVSRNPELRIEGAELAGSLPAALLACRDQPRVFLIGGAELYRLGLPLADRLLLTEVDLEVDGDAWFPEFSASDWVEESRDPQVAANGLRFAFVSYRRRQ